jgi:hypothetical protein
MAQKTNAKSAGNPRKLMIGGIIVVVLAAGVIWLNFFRGESGPDPDAADAARRAAEEMSVNQPEPDPNVPPVPSPAKPAPMGR